MKTPALTRGPTRRGISRTRWRRGALGTPCTSARNIRVLCYDYMTVTSARGYREAASGPLGGYFMCLLMWFCGWFWISPILACACATWSCREYD